MPRERHRHWLGLCLVVVCCPLGRGALAARLGSSNDTFPDWSPSWSACGTSQCYLGISSNFVLSQEASAECRDRKLEAARIDSLQDLKLLKISLWGGVWIGLRAPLANNTRFHWQDGSEPGFTNWDANEPFTDHRELCVIAQQARSILSPSVRGKASALVTGDNSNGNWATSSCQNTFPFVCQLPAGADTSGCEQFKYTSGGSLFCLARNITATWEEAAQLCETNYGGILAQVLSSSDQDTLTDTFTSRGEMANMATLYWIGEYNSSILQAASSSGCNNPSDGGSGSCSSDNSGLGSNGCTGFDQAQGQIIKRTCSSQNLPLCSSGPNATAPDGFQGERGNASYVFMVKPRSFQQAKATCAALGAALAVPEDPAEYQWLVQGAGRYMRNMGFYVGLRGDGVRAEGVLGGQALELWGGGRPLGSPPGSVSNCMSLGGWSMASGHWWSGAWWPVECNTSLPFVCKQVEASPPATPPPSPPPNPSTASRSSVSAQLLVPVLVGAVVGMVLLGALMATAFICMGRPSSRSGGPHKPAMGKPSTASMLWVWLSSRPKPPPKVLLPLRLGSAVDSAPITSPGPRSLRSPLSPSRSPFPHSPASDSSSGGSAGRTRAGSPTPLSSAHSDSSASAAAAAAIAAANAAARGGGGGGGEVARIGGRSLTAALAAARGGAISLRGSGSAASGGFAAAAAAVPDDEEAQQLTAVQPVPHRPEGGGLLVYGALADVLAAENAAGVDSGAGVVLDSDPVRADVALDLALGKQVTVHFDQVLGRGSSGAVYRGRYSTRTVAVKVLDALWLDGPREGSARVGAPATARDLRRRLSAMSASASASQGGTGTGTSGAPPEGGPSLVRWYTDQQRDRAITTGGSATSTSGGPPPMGAAPPSRSHDPHTPTSSPSSGSMPFLRPPSVPFNAASPTPPTPQHTPPTAASPTHPSFPFPVANPLYGIQGSPPLTPTSPALSNAAPTPIGPLPSHTLRSPTPAARTPAPPSVTRQSLQQEISILSRVRHPNIIELLGGGLQAREAFLVMELMDCNLGTYVRRRGRLPVVEALAVVRCVAKGLWHLHPTIMHRDLKPENILLNEQGTVKIADFGMSRCKVGTMLFTDHLVAGTVPYMAPECYTGEAASEKADIFSLGVILWFCLTGRKPWAGWNSVAIMYQVGHMHQRPPLPVDPSVCPPEVADLIMACWARDPRVRPPAIEVVRRCTALLGSVPSPVL